MSSTSLKVAWLMGCGLLVSSAAQAIPIAAIDPVAGLVINRSGSYEVTQDLNYSGSGAAITIAASPVVLNLGGHTLAGTSTAASTAAAGIRVVSSGYGASISNGTIANFLYGIRLEGAGYNRIQLITGSHNAVDFVLQHSHGNTIRNNVMVSGEFTGIDLTASNGNRIEDNNLTKELDFGIFWDNASYNNTIQRNTVNLPIRGSGQNNLIQHNTATGSRSGIVIGGRNNTVQHNAARVINIQGSFLKIQDNQVGDIELRSGNDNWVLRNTAANISAVGVHSNYIQFNTVSGAISDDSGNCTTDPVDNHWYKNTAATRNPSCLQ
jgi:parallel beta-helix repeat protein